MTTHPSQSKGCRLTRLISEKEGAPISSEVNVKLHFVGIIVPNLRCIKRISSILLTALTLLSKISYDQPKSDR